MATKTHVVLTEEGQVENPIQVRASDPGSPTTNQIWLNSTEKKVKYYNGTSIQVLNIEFLTSDPGSPYDGQMWVNTTTSAFKIRSGGVTTTISGGVSGPDITWNTITADQTAVVNNGYITNSASRLNVTLPATAAFGSIVPVGGRGTGGWTVIPGSGQNFVFDNTSSSSNFNSADQYATMEFICIVANTTWEVRHSRGLSSNSALAGYFMSGSTDGTTANNTNAIEKLTFSTEARTTISATVGQAVRAPSGVSGVSNGYMAGGQSTGGPRIAAIDRLAFSGEVRTTIAATLDTILTDMAGFSNPAVKGYIAGGEGPSGNTNQINDIVFSGESSSAISSTLPAARAQFQAGQSTTKGYMFAGQGPLTTITALTFSGEGVANISATLSVAVEDTIGNLNSSTKTYSAGGNAAGGILQTFIDALTFSGETRATLSATLDATRRKGAGASSGTRGYVMGGATTGGGSVGTIEYLDLSTEASAAISATLSVAKLEAAGIYG